LQTSNGSTLTDYQIDADAMWEDIEGRLESMGKASGGLIWSKLWKVAAMLLVVCLAAYGYYLNSERMTIEKNGIALHNISSELADTEAFYTAEINEKIELIEVTSGSLGPCGELRR
jgi:hypothetical protein